MLVEQITSISSLVDQWRPLEERIKEAEQITGLVCIPAINELRYSGRRILEAWVLACAESPSESDCAEFKNHIAMARQYFHNADHDLTDSLVSFFAERKKQMLDRYGIDKTTEFYSRFVAWIEGINNAQEIIRGSRGDRHNRFEAYQQLEKEILPQLMGQYRDIVRSEELYSAKLKKGRFIRALVFVFSIVGYVGGLLCLVAEWDKVVVKLNHIFRWFAEILPAHH